MKSEGVSEHVFFMCRG